MIDKATVEKIKAAADIVEVVSDYVHLTRRGSNYMGLCPFHNERTPSFSVNRRKNFCYCFSCHKGGSPVNFIMEKEGISYHDALLQLAQKYGIKVEERELTDAERQAQSEREAMLVVNEWAMGVFEHNLTQTDEGRNVGLQYFYQRGVTDEAIKKFRLGYAIDRPTSLVDEARKAGFDIKTLKSVGLVGESREGRLYDRFRGRVIYPVMNTAGKVVAFGGRDLKGGPAKYINSPESDIYKKSNELYGIYQAKNAISRNGQCFLVEGYMDVIGMFQSGMENVLASSGTALTDGQIALIHRFAEEVTLIYDGDAAGIKASLRGIDMLLAHKLRLKILLLPDGDDPDSFARKHTPEEFREFVDRHAVDVIKFKTQVLMKDAENDPVRRSEAIHSIVKSIASIPDKIQRMTYIQECSIQLKMNEEIIAAETEKAREIILENWRRERERKNIERDFPVNASKDNISTNNEAGVKPSSSPSPSSETVSKVRANYQNEDLEPFEKEVLRYCLKYGMLTLCDAVDINGVETPLSAVDFVAEELEYDNVSFSIAGYGEIFNLIRAMQDDFATAYTTYQQEVDSRIAEERQKGFEEIAEKNLTTMQIELEESHLEERMTKLADDLLRDFAMDYPGRVLASHENDAVRNTVNDLLKEKVILCKRFREMDKGETEFDRLAELLPRAIAEWKDAILARQIAVIFDEIKVANSNSDQQRVSELQQKAFGLMQMRKEAAKNIGERIISTSRH